MMAAFIVNNFGQSFNNCFLSKSHLVEVRLNVFNGPGETFDALKPILHPNNKNEPHNEKTNSFAYAKTKTQISFAVRYTDSHCPSSS